MHSIYQSHLCAGLDSHVWKGVMFCGCAGYDVCAPLACDRVSMHLLQHDNETDVLKMLSRIQSSLDTMKEKMSSVESYFGSLTEYMSSVKTYVGSLKFFCS